MTFLLCSYFSIMFLNSQIQTGKTYYFTEPVNDTVFFKSDTITLSEEKTDHIIQSLVLKTDSTFSFTYNFSKVNVLDINTGLMKEVVVPENLNGTWINDGSDDIFYLSFEKNALKYKLMVSQGIIKIIKIKNKEGL